MTIKETQELRAQRLNAAIEKSGLSYPELEKLTGISKSSLQRYATGTTKKIPIDCLEKLAKILNLDPAYLVFGEDSSPLNPEDYISGKSRLVLKDTKKLTPADNGRSEVYNDLKKLSHSDLIKVEGFIKGLLAKNSGDK